MTSRVPIIPCVNRNMYHVFDQNDNGLVAFGSRSLIYVLDLRTSPAIALDDKIIHNAHYGRVLSVSFCKVSNNDFLASVGEDLRLKIWNLENVSCVADLEVKEYSSIVEWLYDTANYVTFPDSRGVLIKWNFITDKILRIKTSCDIHISILSSNKKSPELLAAGHENGAISILNMVNNIVIHKLRSHSSDISSLSWSPVFFDVLLSTSLDMSARLWKLGEDKPKIYYYPSSRNKSEERKNVNKYCCGICHPENPNVIICSNIRGDLGSITFKENELPKFNSFTGKDWDTSYKSVITMLPYSDIKNNVKRNLFLSLDHLKITLWDFSLHKIVATFPFLVGGMFDLSGNMINSECLAICSGDGLLKVWNTDSVDNAMLSIYIHHKVKVMTCAWHPVIANILAYGCDDGRVGVVDTVKKKSIYSYETHHTGVVYSLQWGPCSKIKESVEEYFLYSCGGGVIYIHELNFPKEKAVDFETLIEFPSDFEIIPRQYSEVSWQLDYTRFAVGTLKGFIDFFSSDFKFLVRVTMQMKNIECLRWHPIAIFSSENISPYKSWLGVVGNDEVIHIIDTSVIGGLSESTIIKSTKTLVGHKKRVSAICWSYHEDGLLVSGARDGTVQVWNVCQNTLIANYPCHRDIVHAVFWSLTDPDIIYSGGLDNSLRMWNISQQKAISPPEKSLVVRYRPGKTIIKQKIETSVTERNGLYEKPVSKAESCQDSKETFPMATETDVPVMRSQKDKGPSCVYFPKKSGHLFTEFCSQSYSKDDYLENILKLVDNLCDPPAVKNNGEEALESTNHDNYNKFDLFKDQGTVLKMFLNKAKCEVDEDKKAKNWYLNLMAANTKNFLTEVAEKKQMSDFLVAMAPSVSIAFWQEICEKFANQLTEEQQFMRASLYFMYSGKLHKAIQLLIDKDRTLEALALAKAHLPESDPMVEMLLRRSAKYFSAKNVVEMEAACYVAMRDPLQAAKALYCTANPKYIAAAVYICKRFNLKEQAEEYGYICMETCLLQNDWQTFYQLTKHIESLKVYTALVKVHELLSKQLKALKKEDGLVAGDIFGASGSQVLIWSGKMDTEVHLPLLEHAKEVLLSEGIVNPKDHMSLELIHQALNAMDNKRKNSALSSEAHICIAMSATQIILTTLLGDFDLANEYFVKIFTSSYGVVFLPKVMCWLFLALDIYYCCDSEPIFQFKIKHPDTFHFTHFYTHLCSESASTYLMNSEDLAIYQDILPDLEVAVGEALNLLSKRNIADSILLYFFASYLNDLKRLTKKGWKFKCYNTVNLINGIVMHPDPNKQNSDAINENPVIGSKSNNPVQRIEELIHKVSKENAIESHSNLEATDNISECGDDNRPIEGASSAKHEINTDVEDKLEEMVQYVSTECGEEIQGNLVSSINGGGNVTQSQNININDVDGIPVVQSEAENLPEDELSQLIHLVLREAEIKAKEILEFKNDINVDMLQNTTNNCKRLNTESEKRIHVNNAETEKYNQYVEVTVKHDKGIECDKESDQINQDDSHIQCWNDVRLCYNLTKCLKSVLCRDEYALLHCLENYLGDIDAAISSVLRKKLAMQNAKKKEEVVNKPTGAKKKKTIIADKEQIKPLEDCKKCDEHLLESVSDCVIEEDPSILLVTNEPKTAENLLINEINFSNSKISDTVSDSSGNLISIAGVPDSGDILRTEVTEENNEKYLELADSKTTEKKVSQSNIVNEAFDEEIDLIDFGGKRVSTRELFVERKRIAEQVALLKSVNLSYPNPFDAAVNIIGICCDIFHKNTCEVVQVKFHAVAHEVMKWKHQFYFGEKPIFCEICQKTLCV